MKENMSALNFDEQCLRLRQASAELALLNAAEKQQALRLVAKSIKSATPEIISANAKDVQQARNSGLNEYLIDRLLVTNALITSTVTSLEQIADMEDVVGEIIDHWTLENGLEIRKVRTGLGVVAIIYESRPAVTVDAFAIAFKSSNSILLRGSKTAQITNQAFVKAIVDGLNCANLSRNIHHSIALLPPSNNYDDVTQILNARGKIDCVVPRGGRNLIENVVQNASIPVIETGAGVCHLYVDAEADLGMAVDIALNAKLSRPSVCNALECVVLHQQIQAEFIAQLVERANGRIELLTDQVEANWGVEWLSPKLSVKFVESTDQAIEFINKYNTKHSETIVTTNQTTAAYFQTAVDAACVYVNASTRFTDGGQFGFGAELGISTQKLHVRGPMGIGALTTYKYLVNGTGQVRE
jgi:glutamate-5-semialdehyde dehydrogenase